MYHYTNNSNTRLSFPFGFVLFFSFFFPNVQAKYHNDELEKGIGHQATTIYLRASAFLVFFMKCMSKFQLQANIFRHVGIAIS